MNKWHKHSNRCFTSDIAGVELRIWLKQGKEKAQTRKGKKTAGKEKRLLARILEKARKRLSRQNSTKKCVNVRGKRPQFYKKHNNFRNYVLKYNICFLE